MIHYEVEDSPFYKANKNYCLQIENRLKELNIVADGFCNSFGYEIKADFERKGITYKLEVLKTQSTRNGVIWPENAKDYAGLRINIGGLNKKHRLHIGRNSVKRFFITSQFRKVIPSPYFVSANMNSNEVEQIIKEITTNDINDLNINNGNLHLKIHKATNSPVDILLSLERLINTWP